MPNPSSGFATINDTRLYYEQAGSGPALVLLHGFTLDTRMWDDQFETFAQTCRVIRYDLRGFGKSDLPGEARYAHHEDLKALLDHLGVTHAHILGLSLGGAIAINFALAYPEMTRSLIPVDSALDGHPWHEELSRWFDHIESTAKTGDLQRAKDLWLATGWFAPANEQPAVAARLRRIVSDYSGWHFSNPNPVRTLKPTAGRRLSEISAPTLVIIGERDLDSYNLPIADRLAHEIPNARKAIIPAVGHMANMEAPLYFNNLVLDFLAQIQ